MEFNHQDQYNQGLSKIQTTVFVLKYFIDWQRFIAWKAQQIQNFQIRPVDVISQ